MIWHDSGMSTATVTNHSTPRPRATGGNRKGSRASFGNVRKLPSGRFQARYTAPDGKTHTGPTTFETKGDAQAFLALRQSEIMRGKWVPAIPEKSTETFANYATRWLAGRTLKPRTRSHYQSLLDGHLVPEFGNLRPEDITPDRIRTWHTKMGTRTPTLRAHAYALLRTIMGTAVQDGLVASNPCHIRGAGSSKRRHEIKPLTLAELGTLVRALPPRYRAMVLLSAWCALRFGEVTELRRGDVELAEDEDGTAVGVVHVRRGVTRVGGEFVVGSPKSDAGVRDVAIPPHIVAAVRDHLDEHVGHGKDALLFPAAGDTTEHLAPTTLYKVFYPAREAAGRPDVRFHDLRHTGAVLAAQAGATLAELMGRLGHTTPQVAMRYQHVAQGRDAQLARALSAMAGGAR